VIKSELTGSPFGACLVASDTSIKVALEPVRLIRGVCEGSGKLSSPFTIQPVCLDQPGTGRRILHGASKVPDSLGVVVRTRPAGGGPASNRQPSNSDVVHPHMEGDLPLRVAYERLAGTVRMLGEDVQAMALRNAYAIDMPAPDTLTRRLSALQASIGSVSTLSSCTSAT
jgi:hypothetical protein